MSEDLLKGWLNYKPVEKEDDINLLLSTRSDQCLIRNFQNDEYFNLMPNCNISSNTNELYFSECATNFINELFNKYVDDETLVISTSDEHDNVKKCVETCKNKLILDYHEEVMNLNLNKVKRKIHGYKKVFVYIIGTQISTGEITPQCFFKLLKDYINTNGIRSIFVLDDVHGMFLFPRNYSLFDFVLFTAHALIKGYDMGLLVAKKELDFNFGQQMCNWATDYFAMLKLILDRKDKLFMFASVMENYFADLLSTENFISLTRTSPHIFSMLVKGIKFPKPICEMLNEYKIRIENGGEKTYIRFRAQHYIQKPELLITGVKKFRFILDEILNME